MGCPMLNSIQNNVVFLTVFFTLFVKGQAKQPLIGSKVLEVSYFLLQVESKRKFKEICLLAASYKMRKFISK